MLDLLVIGGGVNGTGIARDAAMRGLSVMLIEKKDFAAGASGANSGMIHGGARYLLTDRDLTRIACIDSGYIQRIAPHLLFRIPFLFPVLTKNGHATLADRAYLYSAECYFAEYDRFQPLKNGKQSALLNDKEMHDLEPGLAKDLAGGLSTDEYGIDPFRLCTLNARSAAEHGAEIANHTEVTHLLRGDGGRVEGAGLRHALTGERREVRARAVFNACGAWGPKIAALAGVELKLRPAKGVHVTLDRRLSNYGVSTRSVDGRDVFILPHEDSTIIGTTDDDYYGDPDDVAVHDDEVKYLLQSAEAYFPAVREARVLRAWAGVRPTLYEYGPLEDKLSRDHVIHDHAEAGAPGLFSIVGGKLASFRLMSEEAVDAVCRALGKGAPCTTHTLPLPGGEATAPGVDALTREHQVPPFAAARLSYRHGSEAPRVLALCAERQELRAQACPCEGVLFAELAFALRSEFAEGLLDLRRRCRLGMGICQGARCAGPAAALYQEERKATADEALAQAEALLDERWKGHRPVLGNDALAQAELTRGTYFTTGALRGAP